MAGIWYGRGLGLELGLGFGLGSDSVASARHEGKNETQQGCQPYFSTKWCTLKASTGSRSGG